MASTLLQQRPLMTCCSWDHNAVLLLLCCRCCAAADFTPTVLPDLYLSSHSTSGDMTVMLINRGTASVMLQAKNSTALILSKTLPLLAGRNPAQHKHGHLGAVTAIGRQMSTHHAQV